MEITERLWRKVDKTAACWLWTAALDTNGYGQFSVPGKPRKPAHKVVFEMLVEDVPRGLTLDHLCREKRCVNPSHLEIVTAAENTMRGNSMGAINKAKTHCKRGHAFTGHNLQDAKKNGKVVGRRCRQCSSEWGKEDYKKRKSLKHINTKTYE